MPILCFANPGEIDPRLIITLGVNVKETTNPIGIFGTGLKYAIAVVLRLGGKVTIQSGEGVLTFDTYRDTIRGKEFSFIRMNGSGREGCEADNYTLAFTTDLGKNWQPWMAYRELFCNVVDENGHVVLLNHAPPPMAGHTRVLIEEPELIHIHENPKDWLLDKSENNLLWKTPSLECYSGPSNVGFYRGIKVLDFPKPTVFTYNIIKQMELTEDRTMSNWDFTYLVTSEVLGRDRTPIPPSVLKAITHAKQENAERDFYWTGHTHPRAEIISAATSRGLSPNLRKAIASYLPPKPLGRTVFDDLQEDAPSVPEYTCGYINSVQEVLREQIKLLSAGSVVLYSVEELKDLCGAVADNLGDVLDDGAGAESPLEKLRQLNSALRESGKYWREECKRLTQNLRSPNQLEAQEEEEEGDILAVRVVTNNLFATTAPADDEIPF